MSKSSSRSEGGSGSPLTNAPAKVPLVAIDAAISASVQVTIDVQIGSITLSLQELIDTQVGGVITLDSQINDPVKLYVNDALVALGELIAVDDRFGVKITEISK